MLNPLGNREHKAIYLGTWNVTGYNARQTPGEKFIRGAGNLLAGFFRCCTLGLAELYVCWSKDPDKVSKLNRVQELMPKTPSMKFDAVFDRSLSDNYVSLGDGVYRITMFHVDAKEMPADATYFRQGSEVFYKRGHETVHAFDVLKVCDVKLKDRTGVRKGLFKHPERVKTLWIGDAKYTVTAVSAKTRSEESAGEGFYYLKTNKLRYFVSDHHYIDFDITPAQAFQRSRPFVIEDEVANSGVYKGQSVMTPVEGTKVIFKNQEYRVTEVTPHKKAKPNTEREQTYKFFKDEQRLGYYVADDVYIFCKLEPIVAAPPYLTITKVDGEWITQDRFQFLEKEDEVLVGDKRFKVVSVDGEQREEKSHVRKGVCKMPSEDVLLISNGTHYQKFTVKALS